MAFLVYNLFATIPRCFRSLFTSLAIICADLTDCFQTWLLILLSSMALFLAFLLWVVLCALAGLAHVVRGSVWYAFAILRRLRVYWQSTFFPRVSRPIVRSPSFPTYRNGLGCVSRKSGGSFVAEPGANILSLPIGYDDVSDIPLVYEDISTKQESTVVYNGRMNGNPEVNVEPNTDTGDEDSVRIRIISTCSLLSVLRRYTRSHLLNFYYSHR